MKVIVFLDKAEKLVVSEISKYDENNAKYSLSNSWQSTF